MAFFGLTNLGYQDPIGDKLIVNPKKASQDGKITMTARLPPSSQVERLISTNASSIHPQHPPYSTEIHRGSQQRYKEMVRKVQTPRSPDQLYIMPVADSMKYGWMLHKIQEPWTRIKHFPKKNSEMTKYAEEMMLTDGVGSLCTI